MNSLENVENELYQNRPAEQGSFSGELIDLSPVVLIADDNADIKLVRATDCIQ